jgi:hypothetical protein
VTTKTIDTELNEILARASKRVAEDERPRPDPDEQLRLERLERRVKAMAGKGWEQLALRRVRGPDYDEGRAVAYIYEFDAAMQVTRGEYLGDAEAIAAAARAVAEQASQIAG